MVSALTNSISGVNNTVGPNGATALSRIRMIPAKSMKYYIDRGFDQNAARTEMLRDIIALHLAERRVSVSQEHLSECIRDRRVIKYSSDHQWVLVAPRVGDIFIQRVEMPHYYIHVSDASLKESDFISVKNKQFLLVKVNGLHKLYELGKAAANEVELDSNNLLNCLHVAVSSKRDEIASALYLLYKSRVHSLASEVLKGAIESKNAEIVNLVLPDIDISKRLRYENQSQSPLQLAVLHYDVAIFNAVLSTFLNCSKSEQEKQNVLGIVLRRAIEDYNLEAIKMLIDADVDVTREDLAKTSREQLLPLTRAVTYCDCRIIELLLQAGASVLNGSYLIQTAISNRSCVVISQLLLSGVGRDEISNAIQNPYMECYRIANPRGVDERTEDILHTYMTRQIEGESARDRIMACLGEQPIHRAAREGDNQVIRASINASRDALNCVRYDGCSPLHLAALKGHISSVALLLVHGANIAVVDGQQKTPANLAMDETIWVLFVHVLSIRQEEIGRLMETRRDASNSQGYEIVSRNVKSLKVLSRIALWSHVRNSLSEGLLNASLAMDQLYRRIPDSLKTFLKYRDDWRNIPGTQGIISDFWAI